MEIPDQTHVQTTFFFFYNSQIATNVRTWKWVAGTLGQPTNTAKIDAAFNTATLPDTYAPLMATGVAFQGIRYVPVPNSSSLAPVYSTGVTGTGTGGGVALPKQTSALIRLRTLVLGKKGENRIYVPFPSQDANETTGLPNAGYIANLVNLALLLAGPIPCDSTTGAAGNLVPTVNKRPDNTIPLTLIASGVAGHAWATQRRRGDYGKVNKSPFA